MADYAPHYTPRMKLRYRAGGTVHAMTWRRARGADVTAMVALADKAITFLNALAPQRYTDWTLLDVSYALEDSEVFLPLTPTETLLAGSSTFHTTHPGAAKANAISYVGRGITGQKAKFFVFGTAFYGQVSVVNDLRIYSTEETVVADSLIALTELAPALVASDDSVVTWYSYVNQKLNDYWVNEARDG